VPEILPLLLTSLLNDARGSGTTNQEHLTRNTSTLNLNASVDHMILRTLCIPI
jgi:hypothetical protein